jgi:Mannosyl-glycoprotein endo-beta-N-acetylglucosaminidase/LysM domain
MTYFMKSWRQSILLLSLLAIGLFSLGQQSEVIQQYITTYKDLAIAEMQRTGIPASIKLAQGIHETLAGTSDLVLKSNNHFGIKCKANWTGESVSHDDDARGECFRKYTSAADSYRDHSDFLKNSQRYASLFTLDPLDYQGWANGLKKAGYATNPRYPLILIKLIEDYQLQDYTMIALGKMPADGIIGAKTETGIQQEAVAVENEQPVTPPEEIRVPPSYPVGEFMINETKVVFVKKGVPYLFVAQQNQLPLARIFEFNEMKQCEITACDQLIYLQRKRKTGKAEFHIVQSGESLHDIAQEEAIRLESLQEYNWLKDDQQPAVGEILSLLSKSAVMPKLVLKDNYSITPASQKRSNN